MGVAKGVHSSYRRVRVGAAQGMVTNDRSTKAKKSQVKVALVRGKQTWDSTEMGWNNKMAAREGGTPQKMIGCVQSYR